LLVATRFVSVALTSFRQKIFLRKLANNMERRVLFAVFLSFLVLYIYQALIGPPREPQEDLSVDTETFPTTTLPESMAIDSAPDTAPESVLVEQGRQASRLTSVERPSPNQIIGDNIQRDIVVENDVFRAVFTNRGGELVSWKLKNYLENGQPVELIPSDLSSGEPWPFSLAFEDENLTNLAHEALYRSSSNNLRILDRTISLSFDYEDANGLRISKVFLFDPTSNPYLVDVTIKASLGAEPLNAVMRWGPALGGDTQVGSMLVMAQQPSRALFYGRLLAGGVLQDLDIERLNASDVVNQSTYTGQMEFLGVDNHYFLAAALPSTRDTTIAYRTVPVPPLEPDGAPRNLIAFDLVLKDGISNLPFFLGPKDFDILAVAAPSLVRAVDFGWLSFLIVPLHRSLKWIYGFLGNWGWAIIVLTLVINVLIFPLRHKSVVSMRKMQELQPEMKAIQERYANLKATDPGKQKMNQEIMSLYRDRGVNPASGCLPMLLTMPILFAFYRLLSMAIEIRGEPFILWITDLSVHDPWYITPIIMGVSMVVTQRLTPSQADPTQQKIMMFMPIMFTFMFLWAPAGLVLYWLTSNMIGIGQQVITNRIIGPPKKKTIRPPAERLVKKRGENTKVKKK
jgi:YidC/Oxa1 family membrane protein insertase